MNCLKQASGCFWTAPLTGKKTDDIPEFITTRNGFRQIRQGLMLVGGNDSGIGARAWVQCRHSERDDDFNTWVGMQQQAGVFPSGDLAAQGQTVSESVQRHGIVVVSRATESWGVVL